VKDEFIKIYTENIHREGADGLLAWLGRCDFFTAPASTKYHGKHEGGLCEHSINVYRRLLMLTQNECPEAFEPETVTICGLLHDICKANFYKKEWKNKKTYCEDGGKRDEGGNFKWETVSGYSIDEKFPFGHGEKSVFLIERFMKLEIGEAVAIRFHMGDYGDKDTPKAFSKYPLALMLHIADMEATFVDESEDK
jgi:hypothetical protein